MQEKLQCRSVKPCKRYTIGQNFKRKACTVAMALLVYMCSSVATAQILAVNPSKLQRGGVISFTYDPRGGKFEQDTLAMATVIVTDGFDQQSKKVALTKEGKIYHGKFQTDSTTLLVILAFSSKKIWDLAPVDGYIYPVCEGDKPVDGALTAMADFYISKYRKTIYGVEPNYQKAAELYQEELSLHPNGKYKLVALQKYYQALYKLNPDKGKAEILSAIKTIDQQQQISDVELYKKYRLYEILDRKVEMENTLELISAKFPNSPVIFSRRYKDALTPRAAAQMELMGSKLIIDYAMEGGQFSSSANSVYRALNQAYLKEMNLPKFYFYLGKLTEPSFKLIDLINAVTFFAETKRELNEAEKISNWGLRLIDTLTLSKSSLSPQRLKEKRTELTGMLGRIYYEQGKFGEAYTALKSAHQENTEQLPFIPLYYALALVKQKEYKTALPLLADAIRLGRVDDEVTLAFQEAFINDGGSLSDYTALLTRLKVEAVANKKSTLTKIMQKIPAPNFTLLDHKGKRVSLADYKGKIVVLDFWATWCIPCLEAFPGMNKLVKKYQNEQDVVFLFINTSETFTKDLTKNINAYLKKQGYNFHVLIDEKSVMNGVNKYTANTLYDASAIPLKVVIDKAGNIRFKSTGYLGSDEKVVEELSSFIEAAKL